MQKDGLEHVWERRLGGLRAGSPGQGDCKDWGKKNLAEEGIGGKKDNGRGLLSTGNLPVLNSGPLIRKRTGKRSETLEGRHTDMQTNREKIRTSPYKNGNLY